MILTIKDFKKGDIAYIANMNHGRTVNGKPIKPTIITDNVISVGSKYVTTGSIHQDKWENHNAEYLVVKTEYSDSRMLFKTEQEARDYIERSELALWLGTLSTFHTEKYSLEQLRKVKEILEG